MKQFFSLTLFSLLSFSAFCQETKSSESQEQTELKHYMPLYLDIPAEMNVKKGFKEANIGFGYADFKGFKGQRVLVEYDFAPIDKLGFEIELPFIFVQEKNNISTDEVLDVEEIDESVESGHAGEEGGGAESGNAIRIGFHYALYSSAKAKTSIGVGYFNELEFTPFKNFGDPLFEANIYNPFIAIAKIFGERFHTMIYTGTATKQHFENNTTETSIRFNTILSYRFGKANKDSFFAIESNQNWANSQNGQMILRPQAQIQLNEQWKIGLVAAIPIATANDLNGSGFMRLIYSPK